MTAALFARKGDASAEGFNQPEPAKQRRVTAWNRSAYVVLALPVAYLIAATLAVVSLDFDDESQESGLLKPHYTITAATAMAPPALLPARRTVASVQPAPLLKPVSVVSIPVAPTLAKRIRRIPPPPAARKGRYRVQLASLGSAAAVRREWTRLKSTHGKVFRGLRLMIKSSPSNAFYRLQAGPITSRAAARKLCAKLGRPHTACFVLKR